MRSAAAEEGGDQRCRAVLLLLGKDQADRVLAVLADSVVPPPLVQMLGVFAEFERATIIDRVIAGMERKAAKGGWTTGPPP